MFFNVKMEEKFIDVIFSFRISVNLMQMHLFFFSVVVMPFTMYSLAGQLS